MSHSISDKVELLLSWARATPQYAADTLRAAYEYLDLYRPSALKTSSAAAALREYVGGLTNEQCAFNVEPVHDSTFDAQQVQTCVQMLVQSVEPDEEAALVGEVFDLEGAPCIALTLEGPGRFRQTFDVDGLLPVSLEEIEARWTSATRGGRFDRTSNGLLLKLTGQRMPPEPTDAYEPLRLAVEEALLSNSPESLDNAFALVDGAAGLRPADVRALLSDTIEPQREELTQASITLDTLFSTNLPPVMMQRNCLRRFVESVLLYAKMAMPEGGTLALLLDYDVTRRVAEIVADLSGKVQPPGNPSIAASMRRAIEDVHGGVFAIDTDVRRIAITAGLPDSVGRALDAWIPQCDSFSERSLLVLRLLKSGGQTPPEDLLLAGVLEEELERWLLPKLSEAAAVNVAHDIVANVPRLEKALGQIKRGKPKREIVRPGSAADLLRAFNGNERARKAIGIDGLSLEEVERLAAGLSAATPDYAECLRIVARGVRVRA